MENKKKIKKYIKPTTFEQRKLLIDAFLKTNNINHSCKEAGVSINTFRKWYGRYMKYGTEGIKKLRKHIRKNLGRIPEKYALRVIEIKRLNPKWGRRTIASVINGENKRNVISPGGVQRVLERAGLWNEVNINHPRK